MLFLVVGGLGCEPPDNALVHGCTRSALDLSSRCYLRAQRLDREQFASFDADTKNERVRVEANIRLKRGEVAIQLPGCPSAQGRGTVIPGRALLLHCDAKLNRNDFTLSLSANPTSLPVEGLEGDVTFRPM